MRQLSRPGIRLGAADEERLGARPQDLMEYPPTYCKGRLLNLNRGKTVALDAETGGILWSRKASGLMASARQSPANA